MVDDTYIHDLENA